MGRGGWEPGDVLSGRLRAAGAELQPLLHDPGRALHRVHAHAHAERQPGLRARVEVLKHFFVFFSGLNHGVFVNFSVQESDGAASRKVL